MNRDSRISRREVKAARSKIQRAIALFEAGVAQLRAAGVPYIHGLVRRVPALMHSAVAIADRAIDDDVAVAIKKRNEGRA